jgi:hypothetical protein
VCSPERLEILPDVVKPPAADAGSARVRPDGSESKDEPTEVITAPAERGPDFGRECAGEDLNLHDLAVTEL